MGHWEQKPRDAERIHLRSRMGWPRHMAMPGRSLPFTEGSHAYDQSGTDLTPRRLRLLPFMMPSLVA